MSFPNVKGFQTIDIPTGVGMSLHSLFIKEHSDNKEVDTKGRVLFVGNIDYCQQRSPDEINSILRELFGAFGTVESISISEFKQDQQVGARADSKSTRFAHLTFSKRADLKAALNTSYEQYFESAKAVAKKWGISNGLGKRSRTELSEQIRSSGGYANVAALREEVNAYLQEFEEGELIAKQEREKMAGQMDADGFISVKLRNKKKRVDEKRGTGKQRSRGAKKNLELKNFYRFQMRDEKKTKLFELRQKFEEDKQRIAVLKSNRKFKPF